MRIVLIVSLLFAIGSQAIAQTSSPSATPSASVSPAASPSGDLGAQRIEEILTKEHLSSDLFAQIFLDKVSATKVEEVVAQLKSVVGDFKSVRKAGDHYIATFVKGADDVYIHFDAESKIDGLFFRPPQLSAASLDDALRKLAALPGKISYVVVEGRSQKAALNPSLQLSVGSSFKLAILNAIVDEVQKHRLRWNQVFSLQRSWKSLPSGVLQTWPDGTAITLQTYATLMISQSDNTAADALHAIAGDAAINPYAEGNRPFLTTLQMFKLKSPAGHALAERYLQSGTPSQRAKIVREAERLAIPTVASYRQDPSLLYIEWHYSVTDLCRLMQRVETLPLMSIEPGVAHRTMWKRLAYKGGSDAGVINMTTYLEAANGKTYCVSATENDRSNPIDDSRFSLAYGAVLAQLRSDP